MRIQNFRFEDLSLEYAVSLGKIQLSHTNSLDELFDFLERFEKKYPNSIIQFFNTEYLISAEHIYKAIYYVKKAFLLHKNISNKPNIELFLYLATNRQIKVGLDYFGVKENLLKMNILDYCIVSNHSKIEEISQEIINTLKAQILPFEEEGIYSEKFQKLKDFYEISQNQIQVIVNSYQIQNNRNNIGSQNNEIQCQALLELIFEKMAMLYLENV